jgi:hypothetical protein
VNISVYIEHLILDGISLGSGQGTKVKASIEAELSRLLEEGGLASSLQSDGAFPSVSADSIHLSGECNAARLGKQIARSVYRGIGGTYEHQSTSSNQSGQ